MPGLIPLMLRPSEPPKSSSPYPSPIRTNFNNNQQTQIPSQSPIRANFHQRQGSPCPSPTRTNFHQKSQSSPCPSPIRTHIQQAHLRSASTGAVSGPRPSQQKPHSQLPPANLPSIPYTPAEWKKAITEVKQQHMNKRYRACSARCAEILDNLKDPSQVEPAYLIYLHFYAAVSMEMCTRPLPLTSPYRAALLQQARNHYDRATCLIQAAEDSVAVRTRSNSAASSVSGRSCPSSSLHSPSDSINSLTSVSTADSNSSSSVCWTADTCGSASHSPSPSLYSFDNDTPRTPPPPPPRAPGKKRVKKVSFSLPLCAKELAEQEREAEAAVVANFRFPSSDCIIVRPDSPTLGFDDEYFHAGASLRDLPAPPLPSKSSLRRSPPSTPLPTTTTADDQQSDVSVALPEQPGELHLDPDFFRVERSVHKYNATLTHLRSQLARHSHNLGTQLVQAADINSSRPSSPAAASSSSSSPTTMSFEDRAGAEAARAAEKQARIQRLRKNGWVRKRFDGRRYEELAREVLAELEPNGGGRTA